MSRVVVIVDITPTEDVEMPGWHPSSLDPKPDRPTTVDVKVTDLDAYRARRPRRTDRAS